MTDMVELKPCPLCAQEVRFCAYEKPNDFSIAGRQINIIICDDCDLECGHVETIADDEVPLSAQVELAAIWNKRP